MPKPKLPAVSSLTTEIELCPGDVALVRLHGKLVAGTTGPLYSKVDALMPEIQHVVMDLSDLQYMDSMGLGGLVRLYVTAKAAGCTMELKNLSTPIRHLLGLTRMLNVFPIVGEAAGI
ncbi:MAG: STAS domain-containing protein [Acidobacteriota bacterium]|nr:STAS domain-containing protein [Acidobacteriota bacterium]